VDSIPTFAARSPNLWYAVLSGIAIGTLGGMIGLGGAEFRLPLLIGMFGFVALEAVIVNKATSLIVVSSALIFRTAAVPTQLVFEHLGDHRQSPGR
jgi:uncharacterized membrane protein YfcA